MYNKIHTCVRTQHNVDPQQGNGHPELLSLFLSEKIWPSLILLFCMWLCVNFINIKPFCGCCCSLTQTSSHIEITQREQVNQRSLNTCKSFLWSSSLCLVLLWPVQSRLASGQLVCSGHILIQMKRGRSKELLYGAWAPGPGPQLLSRLHNYSAECEYSLMFVLLPKGVYIWGWGGPFKHMRLNLLAENNATWSEDMSLKSTTSMCHCFNKITQ